MLITKLFVFAFWFTNAFSAESVKENE